MSKKEQLRLFFQNKNICVSASGHVFLNTKVGIIPKFLKSYFKMKDDYSDLMNKANQKATECKENDDIDGYNKYRAEFKKYKTFRSITKLILNSTYGIMANQYSRFYNPAIAESITTSSRLTILESERYLNEYFNLNMYKDDPNFIKLMEEYSIDTISLMKDDMVVTIDTDSLIFDVNDLVNSFNVEGQQKTVDFILKLASVLQEYLNKRMCVELKESTYNSTSEFDIDFKQEMIGTSGIFLAKKKYAIRKINDQGTKVDEIELKGIDVVKSSTPEIVKEPIKKIINIFLKNPLSKAKELALDIIIPTEELLLNSPPEDIAIPVFLTNYDKYVDGHFEWISGAPYHAKGSILHNRLIHLMDLPYETIRGREYVQCMSIVKQDGFDTICFKDFLPEEMKNMVVLDYKAQVNKIFIDKIKLILKSMKLDNILSDNQAFDLF